MLFLEEYKDLNHSYFHKGIDHITELYSLVLNYLSCLENSTLSGTSFNMLCFN